MSFISKLLGKTEREEPVAPDEEAPALTPASEGSPADDAPANTSESQITLAPTADSTSASQGGEWWESSSDLTAETIQANELAEPIPASIAAPESAAPAVDTKPEGYGTRPLDEHHAALRPTDADTPEPDDDSGTRPLTSADLPALVALHSRRGLAFAALRDVGRVRSINQDSIFAMLTTLPREGNDLPLGLFIVADGMGGHQGGEVASRLAISTVAQHVMAELIVPALTDDSTEALQPLIIAAVQEANRVIWEQAQTVGSDMGTTCTVALLLGHALYLGHVGDSRAYLATSTDLRQLTNDHSTVGRLIQVGQLDPTEAREHPLRSQLYRTVGQQPEVLVDFNYVQLGGATHLLLASDGLWGMIDDSVMLDVLHHHFWPQDACNELIARANLAGGDDNISAIVVSFPANPA